MVAPGLTFFRAYYTDVFSISYSRLTITDQIFRSVVPTITTQVIFIALINWLTCWVVRLDVIGMLLLGAKEDATIKEAFSVIQKSLPLVIAYHLSLILLGLLLGWFSRRIVRHFKLDRQYHWLRFDNKWHYILSGEVVEFGENKPEPHTDTEAGRVEGLAFKTFQSVDDFDLVFIDTIVSLSEGDAVYSGVLFSYDLDKDGGLSSIQLKGAQRKNITLGATVKRTLLHEKDRGMVSAYKETELTTLTDSNEYYQIPGDALIIPYSQIINMNVTYYKFQKPVESNS